MKKQAKAILLTALALVALLVSVLVFFSCSVGPDPEVEADKDLYRQMVQSSSWSLKAGRKLVSSAVPEYFRNVSSIDFGVLSGDRVNCTVHSGGTEYSLAYMEFSSYDSGTFNVYEYSTGTYVSLKVKFSDSNMRLKYSESDYADFKQD